MKSKIPVKILSLLIVMMLFITTFSGCDKSEGTGTTSDFNFGGVEVDGEDGNGDSTNNNQNADPGKTTSLSALEVLNSMPKAKVKELKLCCWEDYRNSAYGNALEEFERRTGVKIKPQIITKTTYDAEVAALIAAGNSPDLVLLIQTTTSSIKNLQPIENTGFNFNDTAWSKNIMEDFTFNGKTYAMAVKNSPMQNVGVILYNKKALKKAEMEDPYKIWKKNPKAWTWDKLWSMCETFLDRNKHKEGYYGINLGNEDMYLRCFGAGLQGFDPKTGKFKSYITSSQSIERYTILMDKIDKKLATSAADINSFRMGYSLFNITYSSYLEKANTQLSQMGNNVGAVPIPTDSTTVPGFEYCAWGIPIGSKNKEVVPYFVRWTFGPDLYDMSNFYDNEEAKIVVEEMLSRGDTCHIRGWNWEIWNKLVTGGSSQVKTVLDSYASTIADEVATQNKEIADFSK